MPVLSLPSAHPDFYGKTVVRAAFVLAVWGWGVGFYAPPIFMQAVVSRTGWPLALVSGAVTLHFVAGAVVVACLPRIHRQAGIAATTVAGAVLLALGTVGWAIAARPWQLLVAAAATGAGWVPLGAAGINAIVSPWFVRQRPAALAMAYNGASVGGVIFSPLWVALIAGVGFLAASLILGLLLIATVLCLSLQVFSKTPEGMGQHADGARSAEPVDAPAARPLESATLWKNREFLTLAAAMALGLFAQIGLIAHLYALLVPAMGSPSAGASMALATGCGIAGRTAAARLMGPEADRRRLACASYGVQAAGTALLLIGGAQLPLVVLGIALFGLGIGNATSLPPLIAQREFAARDVPRAVAQSISLSQATYAFAPAAFAILLTRGGSVAPTLGTGTAGYFGAVLCIQAAAMACLLAGGRRPR